MVRRNKMKLRVVSSIRVHRVCSRGCCICKALTRFWESRAAICAGTHPLGVIERECDMLRKPTLGTMDREGLIHGHQSCFDTVSNALIFPATPTAKCDGLRAARITYDLMKRTLTKREYRSYERRNPRGIYTDSHASSRTERGTERAGM